MKQHFQTSILSVLLCLSASPLFADVIVSFTPSGSLSANTSNNLAQSVTTPNTTPHRAITFNFFDVRFSNGNVLVDDPFAEGELFLLTDQYLGSADDLSASTPGFVAQTTTIRADGDGTEWEFDANLVLNPNTKYYFYVRNQDSTFGTIKTHSISDLYAGGEYYQTIGGGSDFNFGVVPGNDWLFELEGTAVPEPASFALLSIVLGGGVVIQRRRSSAS